MLFMVIEYFKDNDPRPVGERFKRKGRMLPDDVVYHGSWIDDEGTSCFQLVEAASADRLQLWIDRWSDLVDFEIVPVMSAIDFWARQGEKS
jgi:Protein of unknown function (DUF3303)